MAKPSKQIIIDAIIKEIEQGKTRAQTLGKIGKKWEIASRTYDRYWKTANEQHSIKQQAIKEEIEKVDKTSAIEARESGLKTRNDRLMILQDEVDKCLLDLYPIKGKKPSISIKIALRRTIKDLQSEISKMEGDYAAIRGEFAVSGFLEHLKQSSCEDE